MTNPNHGSTAKHQKLVNDFILTVGQKFPNCNIIPYTNGMFRDFDTASRIIHAGQKGVPDLIVFGCGWYLFFDAKTGQADFSKEQRNWKIRMQIVNAGEDVVHKLKSVDHGVEIIKHHILNRKI